MVSEGGGRVHAHLSVVRRCYQGAPIKLSRYHLHAEHSDEELRKRALSRAKMRSLGVLYEQTFLFWLLLLVSGGLRNLLVSERRHETTILSPIVTPAISCHVTTRAAFMAGRQAARTCLILSNELVTHQSI